MGNADSKDLIPNSDQSRRELDLSPSDINHENYAKHINGDYSETCLREIPWHIRDAISLYERLNVSFNCLTSVPPELPFRIPHLSHLDLSHNQIAVLPESIGFLFHLREFIARHNLIVSLPASITQLSKLTKIDLSFNELGCLPNRIGDMRSLKKLNVSQNKLQTLPASLGKCQSLQIILAVGNTSMQNPPLCVCDAGSEQTLAYLRRRVSIPNGNPDVKENVFPRNRGNQLVSSVPNPHSARAQYVQLQTETLNTYSRIKTPLLPPFKATTLGPYELRDKIIGLIYGAVIGDAIGLCTEFLNSDECQFHYDQNDLRYRNTLKDQHRLHWKTGDWTATGDQMFLVLDSLLHWGGVIDELDFAQRLLSWKETGVSELGDTEGFVPLGTTKLVLQDPDYKRSPHEAARRLLLLENGGDWTINNNINPMDGFADNGALSRAIILGIPHFHDIEEVVSNSKRICMATHAAGPCWAAAAAISALIAFMLQGSLCDSENVEDLLENAKNACLKHVNDKPLKEEVMQYFAYKDYQSIGLTETGKMSYAFKPLSCALVALRSQQTFQESISTLVMHGGHSTVNGAIAGAILGCKCGFSQLPSQWVEEILVPQQNWIKNKINFLLDIMGFP